MSSKYKVVDDAIRHFITFSVVGWIDIFLLLCAVLVKPNLCNCSLSTPLVPTYKKVGMY